MMEEGQNHPKDTHNRIKFEEIVEKGDVDGISPLPDCVLLEILSRLPSTKDTIRTGTLSKRWEHLWTLVPTLNFTIPYQPLSQRLENSNSISDFVLSVDKTLTQCRRLKLKKFVVDTIYDIQFDSQFNNWIRHAVSCNVEELSLDFQYPGMEADFWLHQSLFFISSCFTVLRLYGCRLIPNGAISWTNLKSLCISYLKLDKNLIVNLLSGCPVLETLVLVYSYADIGLHIYPESEIKALKNLSLTQCPQLKKLKKFEVHSLYEIQLESPLNSWIRYAIRCNVKKICLRFWLATRLDPEFKLDQIFFTSSCLTELKLYGCMVNLVGAISWENLRSLSISHGWVNDDLIENILSGSPVLETFELDYCYGYRRLDVTSKSVKNLVLSGYVNQYCHKSAVGDIEINAPDILSLTIQRQLIMRNVLLVNVSSLVKANLNYRACTKIWDPHDTTPEDMEVEMLKEVILKLGHVKEVNIGVLCDKVLSCLQAEGFIVPSNVKFP